MSKLKYIIGSAVIAGAVAVPYITKNTVDELIVEKQKELFNYGIDFQVLTSTGYFESTREVTFKFKDRVKVLDYIALSTGVKRKLLNNITNDGDLFSELSFKGTLKNSNLIVQQIDSILELDELPENLKKQMQKDKSLDKFIKSLGLKMSFDINGKVTDIALNDINIEDSGVIVKVLQSKIQILDKESKTSINNITFNIDKNNSKVLVKIDDIKDHIKKTDTLNLTENTTIQDIKFVLNDANKYRPVNVSYQSTNHIINGSLESDDKYVNLYSKYDIDDIKVKVNNIDTTVSHLSLGINFQNIDRKPIQELVDNSSDKEKFARIMEPKLLETLHSGFKVNLKSTVTNLENKIFSSKMIDVNLDLDVKRNTLTKRSRKNNVIDVFTLNGTIKLDKEVASKLPPIQKFNTNSSNGISQFDIKFVNGKFEVNGQRVR